MIHQRKVYTIDRKKQNISDKLSRNKKLSLDIKQFNFVKKAISTDIDKLKNHFNIDLQSASVNENGDLIKAVSTEKTHHLNDEMNLQHSCYSSSMHINSNTSERAIMIMVPCKGITTKNEHRPTIDIYHCTNHQVSPCVIIGRIAVVVTIVVDIAFHIICDWN